MMRNRPYKPRGFQRLPLPPSFYPLERRVFCPCELCRLRFGVMLYNKVRGGEPLRSYRPGGFLRRRRRTPSFAEEARRQGKLVAATYKDDEDIQSWLDNAERGLDEDWDAIGESIAERYPKTLDRLSDKDDPR